MRNILVLQHVAHEPLGTLNPLLKAHGLRIKYVNFEREPDAEPNIEGYNGLILLGGPMGVYETSKHPHLLTEMKIIEAALKKNIPILGICLGSQLLAHVLGAPVRKGPENETGWHELHLTDHGQSDPLFAHFSGPEKIFQMHGDFFEIPNPAKHLAWSKIYEGQAFRYGEKSYGLQFHLEVDEAMILRWMKRPENIQNLMAKNKEQEVARIQRDTHQYIQRSTEISNQTFTKFIELFDLKERPLVLGSEHGRPRK